MMFDGSIPQYTDHTHTESYKALELYYRQKMQNSVVLVGEEEDEEDLEDDLKDEGTDNKKKKFNAKKCNVGKEGDEEGGENKDDAKKKTTTQNNSNVVLVADSTNEDDDNDDEGKTDSEYEDELSWKTAGQSHRGSSENRQTTISTTTNGLSTLSALLHTLDTENNKAKTNNSTAVYTTMMSAIVNDTALLDFLNNPLEHQVTVITQLLMNNNRNNTSSNNTSNGNNQDSRTCTRSMLSSGVLEVLLLELERLNGETTPGATTPNRFDDPLTTMEKKKQHQKEQETWCRSLL